MMDQNLDEKKLDTIKLRILEMETDNIVKKNLIPLWRIRSEDS